MGDLVHGQLDLSGVVCLVGGRDFCSLVGGDRVLSPRDLGVQFCFSGSRDLTFT